jgi:hypothetical protein
MVQDIVGPNDVPNPGRATQIMVHWGILLHIRDLLTQQKVKTQADAVEIVMRLESTPGEGETSIGLA